jgi:DNA-binding NtrC family response regulator
VIESEEVLALDASLLVVDDEPLIRDVLRDLFVGDGYTVYTAADIPEAETILSQRRIAVALVDLKLPDGSGLNILDRIKQHDPIVSVILMTGYPTIESVVEALQHGACNYLIKPFRLHDLREIVYQAQNAFGQKRRSDCYRRRVDQLEQILRQGGLEVPTWTEPAADPK